jgi:hypothetical protein
MKKQKQHKPKKLRKPKKPLSSTVSESPNPRPDAERAELEQRALGLSLLMDRDKPPSFIVSSESSIPPTHALLGLSEQRTVERGDCESVEEFTARCIGMMPANRPHFILFYAPEESPELGVLH